MRILCTVIDMGRPIKIRNETKVLKCSELADSVESVYTECILVQAFCNRGLEAMDAPEIKYHNLDYSIV